jgi:hypothetical protein
MIRIALYARMLCWTSRVCERTRRALMKTLCDPYRPEEHYMRGFGPKWRAKYSSSGPEVVVASGRAQGSPPTHSRCRLH